VPQRRACVTQNGANRLARYGALAISARSHAEAPKRVASTAKKAALNPAANPRLMWMIVSQVAVWPLILLLGI